VGEGRGPGTGQRHQADGGQEERRARGRPLDLFLALLEAYPRLGSPLPLSTFSVSWSSIARPIPPDSPIWAGMRSAVSARRQVSADFLRELGKLLAPWEPLQAHHDRCARRTDISASPRAPGAGPAPAKRINYAADMPRVKR
jgi:hypothetical protein